MTDTRVVALVVVLLGLCSLACIGGSVWLAAAGKECSELLTLGATGVGALGAVLASTRTKAVGS